MYFSLVCALLPTPRIYMYMYMYIHMYTHIYMRKYIYIYICVNVSISLSLSPFCSLCPPLALSGVDVSAHSLFLLLPFLFASPQFCA